jgi:hypothetical protein
MVLLVENAAPGLAQSLTYWLGQDDSEDPDAQVFELFGTLLEVSPNFMKEVEASQALCSAWGERLHKLVSAEHRAKTVAHSSRIDLIFHGAGCLAEVAMTKFNCVAQSPADAARFRACFSQPQIVYDDICRLLSMTSRANQPTDTKRETVGSPSIGKFCDLALQTTRFHRRADITVDNPGD